MIRLLLLAGLVSGQAHAAFFDPVRVQPVRELPATLAEEDRVIANPGWSDFYAAGWRKILKAPRSGTLDETARSMPTVVGYVPVTNAAGEVWLRELVQVVQRPRFVEQEAALNLAWPLLDTHPATNDIPSYGMTYRLRGYPVTWWVVRQGDLESTQLSAHDEQGRPIYRSRNLGSGQERTIHVGALEAAARTAVAPLLEDLADEERAAMVALYPAWSAGQALRSGVIVQYGGDLYRVVQAHTTQADWTPPAVPALFARIAPPNVVAAWVQPTGGHDAYALGAVVSHNGSVWESTVNANVWAPGVFGWTQR